MQLVYSKRHRQDEFKTCLFRVAKKCIKQSLMHYVQNGNLFLKLKRTKDNLKRFFKLIEQFHKAECIFSVFHFFLSFSELGVASGCVNGKLRLCSILYTTKLLPLKKVWIHPGYRAAMCLPRLAFAIDEQRKLRGHCMTSYFIVYISSHSWGDTNSKLVLL